MRTSLPAHVAPFFDFSSGLPPECTLLVRALQSADAGSGPTVRRIVLLRPDPADASRDSLQIDGAAVARGAWSFVAGRGLLTWHDAAGSGQLTIAANGTGSGLADGREVLFGPALEFLCDVALGAGVTGQTDGSGNLEALDWDAQSSAWMQAPWEPKRLSLVYSIDAATQTLDFTFTDLVTGAAAWQPLVGDYTAQLLPVGGAQGQLQWNLSFCHVIGTPAAEMGGTAAPAGQPDTVYPFLLDANIDAAMTCFAGAMMIDGTTLESGTLVAVRGVFRTSASKGVGAPARGAALVADPAPLSIRDLAAMYVFRKEQGQWTDFIQAAVRSDLQVIMDCAVPSNLWSLLYGSMAQPQASGYLATVMSTPGPNGEMAQPWYESLATAVMAYGVADGNDPACAHINGPRAQAWLKLQTAVSPIYRTHSQLLFQHEFATAFPGILAFQDDQATNANHYTADITTRSAALIATIQAEVASDGSGTVAQLVQAAQQDAQAATTGCAYWAYRFYLHQTSPAIIANLYIASVAMGGTLVDGQSALARDFQNTVAVLTALDDTGYFAERYKDVLNTFLATSVVPSLFGFDQSSDDDLVPLIVMYLQNFVQDNLASEHKELAQAAADLQALLAEKDAKLTLANWIKELRATSDGIEVSLAFPSIARNFVEWLSTTYPKLAGKAEWMGTLFIGGMTALGLFNVIETCKDWSQLSDAERAEVVTDASQLGLQLVFAVLKRGVRAWSAFGIEGLSAGQRAASIWSIVAKGETDVDEGLVRISNAFGRWLGNSRLASSAAAGGDVEMSARLLCETTISDEQSALIYKVMGRDVDEFVGGRLMILFVIAGIGYSIYNLVEGESKAEEAMDGLSIVGGTLMVAAILGGFAAEGTAVAVMASVAGPLSVVVALAGMGLLIWELCQKPTDPMQTFVDDYIQGTPFYMPAACSAVDYVRRYVPASGTTERVGFTLGCDGDVFRVAASGGVATVAAPGDNLPDTTWQVTTDGNGYSQVFTFLAAPDGGAQVVFLTSLADGSVVFQPKTAVTPGGTVTQRWQVTTTGDATLDGAQLAVLDVTLVPVFLSASSCYVPATSGGVAVVGGTLNWSATNTPTVLTLTMSAMAPSFMTMPDLVYRLAGQWPSTLTYAPSFRAPVSNPVTYALALKPASGALQPVPPMPATLAFVSFASGTGAVGQVAATVPAAAVAPQAFVMTALNSRGSAQVTFDVSVPST